MNVNIPRARRYPRKPIQRPIADWWSTFTWTATATSSSTAIHWVEVKVKPPSNEQFALVH